ncbi:hypothetical protein CK203_059823 [Vitis vinifera]|uniref:Uncharacterized protein n=1 Tax=Vitis vinifera TaxID=29760 RepID=A0A438GG32_VITVI|nr:hypothetical protein CK203_059823 [Vitis vinifera]
MASSNTSAFSTPVFNGENYQVWVVKMKAYLRGLGLWQWVEIERQIQPLGNNPTLNQIRAHEEEEAKAPRALSYIHVVVLEPIFTRIMACETPKEAWDKLKEMYLGSDRIRLMEVVNKIRLLGKDLTDQRVVEKVLKYALKVLKKFHMERSKSVATPLVVNEKLSKNEVNIKADASIYRSLMGSLLYLSATRPDLIFLASLLSRKKVKNSKAGSLDNSKSTYGYAFSFAAAANQAIWLRKLLTDLGQSQADAIVIWVDNKSAIAIAKNHVQHGRTKHINVKFHAISVGN